MATIKSLEAEVVGLHYLDKLKPLGCGVERITERQFLQSDLLTPMGLRFGYGEEDILQRTLYLFNFPGVQGHPFTYICKGFLIVKGSSFKQL